MRSLLLSRGLALALALLAASGVLQAQAPAAAEPPAQAGAAAAHGLSEGEVRKVDKAAAKLTLRHGPLVNLDMPAMTMVFRVADPAWLDTLKPGDKVVFTVEKLGGQYTITRLEPAL